MTESRNIVFFDGVCNLCNSTVDLLIKHNSSKDLYFSSLQSAFAKDFLSTYGLTDSEISTIYFYENGNIYERSDAALKLYKYTDAPYRWISYFSFVPKFIRDGVYKLIARNRYRLLGETTSCRMPTAQEKERFIE